MKIYTILLSFSLLGISCANNSEITNNQTSKEIGEISNDSDVNRFIGRNFSIDDSYAEVITILNENGFKTYKQDSKKPNIKKYFHVIEVRKTPILLVKIMIFTEFEDDRLIDIKGKSGLVGL